MISKKNGPFLDDALAGASGEQEPGASYKSRLLKCRLDLRHENLQHSTVAILMKTRSETHNRSSEGPLKAGVMVVCHCHDSIRGHGGSGAVGGGDLPPSMCLVPWAKGEGTDDHYPRALVGERAVPALARVDREDDA